MLKSLSRSFKLINKDKVETAILKATMDDDFMIPKVKHVNVKVKLLIKFI